MATTNKTLNTRVQQKSDIEANWIKATFPPLKGEIIVYLAEKEGDPFPKDPATQMPLRDYYITYPRIKIGDGNTPIYDLPFITDAIWEQVAQAQKFWAEDDNAGAVEFKAVTLAPANQGVY